MNIFLEEFSKINKDKKIVIIMDGAGWHQSKKLIIPTNIRIIILPPYSPELNPTEKLWQYIKDNIIKNRVYKTLCKLENAVCRFINMADTRNH
jgi:transposase